LEKVEKVRLTLMVEEMMVVIYVSMAVMLLQLWLKECCSRNHKQRYSAPMLQNPLYDSLWT
jgi:hypothetical protein